MAPPVLILVRIGQGSLRFPHPGGSGATSRSGEQPVSSVHFGNGISAILTYLDHYRGGFRSATTKGCMPSPGFQNGTGHVVHDILGSRAPEII